MTSQDMYREHMAECLIKTGTDAAQARQEARDTYPDSDECTDPTCPVWH